MQALRTLENLNTGVSACIDSINVELELRKRFAALGLRPGKWVQVLRRASWGGPIHLRVGTTEIILRRHEARCIAVAP